MRGFTLLEVVIVVLLLGILAAAAFPQFASAITQAKLDAASSEVLAAAQYAQTRAASSGQTWRVVFNVTGNSFNVDHTTDQNLSAILNAANTTLSAVVLDAAVTPTYTASDFPEKPGNDYTVNLNTGPNYYGINIVSAAFGSGQTLSYGSQGVPANGGSVTLSYGGDTAVVAVNALTGRATIQ